jgi:hypothetical protein
MKNKSKHVHPKDLQRQFARSGRVGEQADAAEKALDSAERTELEHAALVGKRHAAEEDPTLKKR